jgi:hypothetical protein
MEKARGVAWLLTALTFVLTFIMRVRGISTHFWLLEDQIRDWGIALRPFTQLPLVGPPTHVHGYTIGPAFYWILWGIRVTVGPWFHNLPHAGGIGQALLRSAADALLLFAIYRRTQSIWVALAAVTFITTAAYDVSLAALIWNPMMGVTLAEAAVALLLLESYRTSRVWLLLTAAIAWMAVQAYTGAIFVAVSVFGAMLVEPLARRDWRTFLRWSISIVLVIAALQVPFMIHRLTAGVDAPAMGAVTGSVSAVLTGKASPEFAKSVAGYVAAFDAAQISPWHAPFVGWLLFAAGVVVAVRYRGDLPLVTLMLLTPLTAIVGFALFLAAVETYNYLSLIPVTVLTVVLAATAIPSRGASEGVAGLMLVLAICAIPGRLHMAATMHRMPEYRLLVRASQQIASRHMSMRAIWTEFRLPPTADAEFIYRIMGGRIQHGAPWMAIIMSDGTVVYRQMADSTTSADRP